MDLILSTIIFLLIRSSLPTPMDNNSPSSLTNLQKSDKLLQDSGYDFDADFEDNMRRKQAQINPALLAMLKWAQNPLDLTNIRKREVSNDNGLLTNEFIEEKLTQHSQALEHLLKIAQKNEEMTKILVENINKNADELKPPEKVEVLNSRRSNINDYEEDTQENPLVRLGQVLPRYGSLIANLLIQQVQDVTDPTPLVEVV